MNENIQLSIYYDYDTKKIKSITVKDYKKLLTDKNQEELAKFIYNRLHSRYINPFGFDNSDYKEQYKNGFSMMASYCLLIETLQSFRGGVCDSTGESKKLFKEFFEQNSHFKDLNNKGAEVYTNIRCGILHQGETIGGWKIRRDEGGIISYEDKTINANDFKNKLQKSLECYRDLLKSEKWNSEIWDNFRTKMRCIIENTEVS